MASIDNNDVPSSSPEGEVVTPSPDEGREEGRMRSEPIGYVGAQSIAHTTTWTTTATPPSGRINSVTAQPLTPVTAWTSGVTPAAEESWIQQSLAMPSVNTEASVVATANDSKSGTIETAGQNERSASISVPHHRRDGSLDSSQWEQVNVFPEYNNIDSLAISGASLLRTSAISDTSTSYMNTNSWGSNCDSLDPLTFTTSFSSTDDEKSGMIPSDIHDAARIFNWKMVAELCETKPEAAEYIGEDGWTALHHACNRRCPDPNVMKLLIRAYPDALLITEDKGWTPLHYACRFKAPKDVVKLLLYMYPEKGRVALSTPDRRGRLPLYYSVRYNSPAIRLLLEMDASAVLEEDQNADSPLALIWDDWAEKLDGRKEITKILVGEEATKRSDILMNNIGTICFELNKSTGIEDRIEKAKIVRKRLQQHESVLKRWNNVNIFLKAAFGFPLTESDLGLGHDSSSKEDEKKDTKEECRWRILHAISAIKCHSSLFLLAISLHPEQAFELDNNDLRRIENIYKSEECGKTLNPSNLTALHLATSSLASGDTGKMILMQLLAINPSAAECIDTEESTALHRLSGNKSKSDWNFDAVQDVYDCHKNAITMADANGRLPLHRASSAITYFNSKIEGDAVLERSKICRLLREYVDAASHPDHFGCLPLHLVAQNGRSWDVQAQTLYEENTAAVRARTGIKFYNRLPLHLASANGNSDVSMISNLIKYNPIGASQADRKGLFPLHLACEAGHSWGVVNLVHQAFPNAVEQAEQNKRSWNALHMAASSKCSNGELLSELVKLYPTAASICDSDGRYPLHLACMSGKLWEDGLSSLFEAHANAIRCRDKEGLLPLHIVAFRNCYKPPSECDNSPKITNRSRSKSLMALELDRLTAKEKREAQELSNIFEILKSDPTALIM